jgi:hypothetical protein
LDADPVMRETVCVIDCFNEILYQLRYQWGPTLTSAPSNTPPNPSTHLSTAFQSAWGGSSYDGGKIEAWIAAAWMNDLMYAAHQASENFLYTCSEAWSQARILDTNYSNQQKDRAYYLPAVTGRVVATTITSGGSSYASVPAVSFSDPQTPGGITAQGTATISGGSVSGITIANPGSGYTSPPTVSFNNSNTSGSGAAAIALVPTTSPSPTAVDIFDQHLYSFHPWSADVMANLAQALTLPRPWFAVEMGPENAYPNMYSPRDTTTVTANLWWLDHLHEYGAAAACIESGSNVLL